MVETTMESRYDEVLDRMDKAARTVGRPVGDVRLVAVSKTFSAEAVEAAAACGMRLFGESRVQEAAEKIPRCSGRLEWHFIGHLQRNKIRPAIALFSMVHAVDSWELLSALDGACIQAGVRLPVCLEVNVSGEGSKYGLPPADLPGILVRAQALEAVSITGLMTIPPFRPDPEEARPFFGKLRELRDEARQRGPFPLDELSMGMSHDFEVAIQEGSTLVRLGTVLFGKREGIKRHD